MKSIRKIFYPIYILLLLFGFLFVKDTLKDGDLEVQEKSEEKNGFEEKPAVVFLEIESNGIVKEYRRRLKNTDTVTYLLEILRDEEEIYYETNAHTYGSEFDYVNNVKAPKGYRWALYKNSVEDITNIADEINLEDETVYKFILEKI